MEELQVELCYPGSPRVMQLSVKGSSADGCLRPPTLVPSLPADSLSLRFTILINSIKKHSAAIYVKSILTQLGELQLYLATTTSGGLGNLKQLIFPTP